MWRLHKRTHRSALPRSGPEAPRRAFAQRIDARGVSEITKRSQIAEQIRGVSKSMMQRKVVAARQAPPPEWHAGRKSEERPARHPVSPAEIKARGRNGRKSQKQTHSG